MRSLNKRLRSLLESTVKDARDVAEAAAQVALEQLGVAEAVPYIHLHEHERDLRHKLRIHGRQLGDTLDEGKTQTTDRLIEKIAYEHWHRMLFTRFLAENNLLMYPDPTQPVPITLEECEDLALDEGAENGWELAARYASCMLPQIFQPDSPIFQLALPPEHQQRLERLIEELPAEVFTASDSLGWVYQYWQTKKKDEVNASEVKIGARELPAVTQLFTEPYMVGFLLDNSLGAWWAARRLTEEDLESAESEEELRNKASLPGVPLEYLRFVKDGVWSPAAGAFDGWPENLGELKALDPCCGSGHFLVAAFHMLVPMRMEMEGLSAGDAVDAVLRDNLHGLEIDQRCVELAAFALALAAWRFPGAGGYRQLPELNVACSGLAISAKKEDWLALAGEDPSLRHVLGELYRKFRDAPVLGSLIDPGAGLGRNTIAGIEWGEVAPLLGKALSVEHSDEIVEMGVVAQGLTRAAYLLAEKYHWIITNVPYLARRKQSDLLKDYCGENYSAAKNDIATVFLERCLKFCYEGGTSSIVLPQNWLFLTSYKKLRVKFLKNETWHMIARLGSGAFETISGEIVKVILLIMSRSNPLSLYGLQLKDSKSNLLRNLDVSKYRTVSKKAAQLLSIEIVSVEQIKQLENPDARIVLEKYEVCELLLKYADGPNGMHGGDSLRFRFCFWEIVDFTVWHFFQCTHPETTYFSGKEHVFYWKNNGKIHRDNPRARVQGDSVWGKKGVVVSMMSELPVTLYLGDKFDISCTPIVPHSSIYLPAIWCFSSISEYNESVRRIDQKLNVTNATLVKVPFDLEYWTKVAEERYPNGLPKPYSDDPTQWIFHGHPCGSVIWNQQAKRTTHGELRTDSTVLQIAVARLLGYQWPAEQDPTMELADEAREWVKKAQALLSYADKDGIVCIRPVRGEPNAEDRLENLLAAAYGDEWSPNKKAELLANAGHEGKSLESWLRDKFFTQHCKLFQNRPFIWHIWDGLRDGFSAIVNYHKLDAKLFERLIYTYLGDWISRQKRDQANGVEGAEEKIAAAEALKKRLELILEGEAPYDIFVRWKPIEEQPVGWNPDLNDGVRLNIRPFMSVPDVERKGAGVLHDRPNVRWGKDRGKDVESAPWYRLFEGERINDHHLKLYEKRIAKKI